MYQVNQLTSNGKSHDIVKEYLQNLEGIISIKSSIFEEFITAVAPISVWEKSLETVFIVAADVKGKTALEKFALITSEKKNNRMAIRTLQYKLPKVLRGHVTTVLNTVQAPQFEKSKKIINLTKKIDSKIMTEINNLNSYSDLTDNNSANPATDKKDKSHKNVNEKKNKSDRKIRNFKNIDEKKEIKQKTKILEKNPKRKSISFGFTFPRLLNDVYNIMSNSGRLC